MRADGRTDVKKLIVAFGNFADVPKYYFSRKKLNWITGIEQIHWYFCLAVNKQILKAPTIVLCNLGADCTDGRKLTTFFFSTEKSMKALTAAHYWTTSRAEYMQCTAHILSVQNYFNIILPSTCTGHAVAQLVEALRYKAEGRGFDSRWSYWNFSLT